MTETTRSSDQPIAVLGAGNLGSAIARGIVRSGFRRSEQVHLTHLQPKELADLAAQGHPTGSDNAAAARQAQVVIVSVQPQDIGTILAELAPALRPSLH